MYTVALLILVSLISFSATAAWYLYRIEALHKYYGEELLRCYERVNVHEAKTVVCPNNDTIPNWRAK